MNNDIYKQSISWNEIVFGGVNNVANSECYFIINVLFTDKLTARVSVDVGIVSLLFYTKMFTIHTPSKIIFTRRQSLFLRIYSFIIDLAVFICFDAHFMAESANKSSYVGNVLFLMK